MSNRNHYVYRERMGTMERRKGNRLNIVDGETLMAQDLEPIRYIVSSLLPQGLSILAGVPKSGKSWLALWLCLQVAKGEPVWKFDTMRSAALYLCLEDSHARIQNRLFDITDDAPPNIYFAIMSDGIGSGLEEQIKTFMDEHQDTGLIVIDTLQKVRSVSFDNAYASDYRDLGILKELADKFSIAILLIHHLRKQSDDDPMNMVSGTTGITGAVDSSFVLKQDKRGSERATLICDGRDIEYRELKIVFDRETHLWKLVGDSLTEKPEPTDNAISLLSDYISSVDSFSGTATELSTEIKKHCGEELLPNVLAKKLVRNRLELEQCGIIYSYHRTHDRKEISLSRVGSVCNDGKTGISPCVKFPVAAVAPTQSPLS
jgi:hypothetical protein